MPPETGTLWALVDERAHTVPDALLAVDEHGRRLTFGEYRDQSERCAAYLTSLGVAPGTRVAWQLPTCLEAIVLVGALTRIGAVQIPVLPIYRERELRFILGQAQPSVFIARSSFRGFDAAAVVEGLVGELGLDCRVLVGDGALPEGDPTQLPAPPTDPEEVRWIFYTSGTTGEPKGARHTDASIIVGLGRRGRRLRRHRARPLPDGVPVHAHRRHRHAGHPAAHGRGRDPRRAVRRRHHAADPRRQRA